MSTSSLSVGTLTTALVANSYVSSLAVSGNTTRAVSDGDRLVLGPYSEVFYAHGSTSAGSSSIPVAGRRVGYAVSAGTDIIDANLEADTETTLSVSSLSATDAEVTNAPTDSVDVANKSYVDSTDATVTAEIPIDAHGHLVSTGASGPPTAHAGTSLGSGGSCSVVAGSTDNALNVTLTTGTGSAGTDLVGVNFASQFATGGPRVVVIQGTDSTSAALRPFLHSVGVGGFDIGTVGAPVDSTTYNFEVVVIG